MANKAARKMYPCKDVKDFMGAIGFVYTGEYSGDHRQYIHPILRIRTSVQENEFISLNDMNNRMRLVFLTYICCGQEFDKRGINGDFVTMVKRNFKDVVKEPQKAFSDEQRRTLGIENDSDATMWILRRRAEIIAKYPEIQVKLPPIPKDWEKFVVGEKAPETPTTKNAQRGKPSYNWQAVNAYYENYDENASNPSPNGNCSTDTPTDDDTWEPV